MSAAERRAIVNREHETQVWVNDLVGIIPSITGKIELVYEGEQEGPGIVAQNLIGKALRSQFVNYFPDPEKYRKQKEKSPYKKVTDWFGDGNSLDLLHGMNQTEFEKSLKSVPGLTDLVNEFHKKEDGVTKTFLMEFALHGLAEYSLISKHNLTAGLQFKDLLSGMFTLPRPGADEDDEDDDDIAGRRF